MDAILVPVDFSDYAENALKVAAKIAQKKQAKLYVLHVIEVGEPIMGAGGIHVGDSRLLFFSQLAKKKLHEFLDKDYLEEVAITNIIELGPIYHGIMRNIEKHNIDLIVMGSKGTSGLEGFFIGSNTEKVVRHSSAPVLVIKNDLSNVDFKKIIFASNLDLENISAFKKTQRFANTFNSDIKVMVINTKENSTEVNLEIKEKVQDFLRTAGAQPGPDDIIIHHDLKVGEGILNGAKTNEADLIAIATHGRSGLFQLFNGSIAEKVVNQSKTPVITFKIET